MSKLTNTKFGLIAVSTALLSAIAVPSLVNAQEPARGIEVAALPPKPTEALTKPQQPALVAPSAAIAPTQVDAWTVVLIQTALAEKNCGDVAITGVWDEATQHGVDAVIAQAPQPVEAVASDAMLQLVRTASFFQCPPRATDRARSARQAAPAVVVVREVAPRRVQSSPSRPARVIRTATRPAAPAVRVAQAAPRTASVPGRVNVAFRPTINVPAF